MFYSHDTYGLGHLRRTLALAGFFRSRHPLSQLIVTGSPVAHRFPLPQGVDCLKLPSVAKRGAGWYEARFLDLPFAAIRGLRLDVLLSAARHFRPDVLVVDNVPGGLKGELVPTLRYLEKRRCRLVLGLRDIVDEAEWVRATWAKDASYSLLDDTYDLILVYGEREIYDAVAEYGLSNLAARKTRFVGYLERQTRLRAAEEIRSAHDLGSGPLVLVMAGGGEDGYELLRAVLAAVERFGGDSPFEFLIVGGPFMPDDHRRKVLELARSGSVRYVDFTDDVTSYVQAADAVVSMGGYNSVCELLSLGKPALIVPRVRPRREQLIRARKLSRLGLVRMLDPAELRPRRVFDELLVLLDERRAPARLRMNGLARAADAIDELLATRSPVLAPGRR